ncbi:hypothetical protein [Xanthomonas maliensis]|uniref:hypothetical protein n=1 Tax=Xanthomonas maliensis TaxID=1321368 RepID=UPI0003B5A9BC|nr:hypothetical protein [Xanthomonas maliensis]
MIQRWITAVLIVLGGFLLAGVLGGLVTAIAGRWPIPGAGFCAALTVVVLAHMAAPAHKLGAALGVLVVGSGLAWLLLEPAFYPESYRGRGAYQPTHLPIVATYAGGLVGALLVLAGRWRCRVASHSTASPAREDHWPEAS